MKNIWIQSITVVFLVGCSSSANNTNDEQANLTTQKAQFAFDSMADANALELSDKACKLGSAEGCKIEGEIYRLGRGVKKDYSKAISLFDKASRKDSDNASYEIGKMYYLGKGTKVDIKKAIYYLEKGALNGNLKCINLLAFIFSSEDIVKNDQKAEYWNTKLPSEYKNKYQKYEWSSPDSLQTVGGILKVSHEDSSYFVYKVFLEEKMLDEDDENFITIEAKYSFANRDVIILSKRCGGQSCNAYYYLYILDKKPTEGYESFRSTSFITEGDTYMLFDGETIIIKGTNSILYEDGVAKINGNPVAESGQNSFDLIMSSEWNQKFRQLLGKKYDDFIVNISTSSPTFLEGDTVILGDGCRPQMCDSYHAGFAIIQDPSKKDIKIYAIMNEDGKVTKFGFTRWNKETSVLKNW